MTPRLLLTGVILVAALLVTTVVAPAFAIAGVRPDLVVLSVVGLAFADGAQTGARYGFTAGLLSDLLSSGSQLVGLGSLVLLAVGYLAGLARPYLSASVVGQVVVGAGGTLLAAVGYGVLAVLLDVSTAALGAVVLHAAGLAAYHAALAPLVLGPIAAASARFTPPAT